jgi:small subunit ribosomal protein S20
LERDRERRHRSGDAEVVGGDNFADQADDPRDTRRRREEDRREREPAAALRGGLVRSAQRIQAVFACFLGAWFRHAGKVVWHRVAIVGARMANIASQKKRIERTARERLENRRRVSQVKTWFRRLQDAVDAGDAARADEEFRALVSRIDRAVKTGALHKNTGARRKARASRIHSGISA